MIEKPYENFDLVVERQGEQYRIEVINSPFGQSPGFVAPPPIAAPDCQDLLSKLRRYSASRDLVPEADLEPGNEGRAELAAKDFGGRLFKWLFQESVLGLFEKCRGFLGDEKGLRIRLWFKDAPELANLPWEYLYRENQNRFLALSHDTPLVRYLGVQERIRPSVKLPLRVVVMISNPYSDLDVEREWEALRESLSPESGMILELIKEPTVSALARRAAGESFHVFHYIGHGGFDRAVGKGYLALQDDQGREDTLTAEGLSQLMLVNRGLRLVFLNACESARSSEANRFAGVAQGLLEAGVPNVLAMQSRITDRAAITIAGEFYRSLAMNDAVDMALWSARQAIFLKKNYVEWATPALYMRSANGRVLEKGSVDKGQSSSGKFSRIDRFYGSVIDALIGGRLVVFLGPEVNRGEQDLTREPSTAEFPPSDDKIAEHLAELVPKPVARTLGLNGRQNLVQVSQYLATRHTPEWLCSELNVLLSHEFKLPDLHRLFADLPGQLAAKNCYGGGPLIVTSTYDTALEQAFREAGTPYDLLFYRESEEGSRFWYWPSPQLDAPKPILMDGRSNDAEVGERPLLLKVHAMTKSKDCMTDRYVITEDNYIDYMANAPIQTFLPTFIMNKLRYSNILFLGYRLRDWRLRVIFRRVWGDGKPGQGESWVVRSKADEVDDEFWTKRNVSTIPVDFKVFVDEVRSRIRDLPAAGR